MKQKTASKIFLNGVIENNPVVVVLFMSASPVLTMTTLASSSMAMALVFLIVILLSSILVSLLKKIIPDSVKTWVYVLISVGLVSIATMVLNAYFFPVYENIGMYLPLLVVNSVILTCAENFGLKSKLSDSVVGGLAMGVGFAIVMFVMSSVRELFGLGTWFGMDALGAINSLLKADIQPLRVLQTPSGGLFVYGALGALITYIFSKINKQKTEEVSGAVVGIKEED